MHSPCRNVTMAGAVRRRPDTPAFQTGRASLPAHQAKPAHVITTARFHAPDRTVIPSASVDLRGEAQLRGQVRCQVQLGNEGLREVSRKGAEGTQSSGSRHSRAERANEGAEY